ncbi:MAG: TonB-dependent receptor [Acidobacteria bacterium]|nr:TonB-dependent receptor [Acidobacteriota bacterium]
MKSIRLSTIVLLGLSLVPGLAQAQGSGNLEGTIQRENGSGIGGVAVVVNELGLAETSDSQGRFGFQGVPAGTYTLSFSLGDYQATKEEVGVQAGATTRVEETVDWQVSFAETITVVSASRRVERIVEAPAAVTLVTEEEIERQASHGQLPKLLEFTPGAEVTQSGLYDYNFNTRGFNSSLNRRVATLIDGRDPSVPFLGSQEWAAFTFPLDDIASLEVVRGPSAALYGANASSGIVNLVTKQPRYSRGGTFRLAGGELSTFNSDFRYAGELGGDWYVKVLLGARTSGDFSVSRNGKAEYSVPCGGAVRTDCLPQERVPLDPEDDDEIFFGSLRFDKYFEGGSALTFEGGQSDVSGPLFQTGIGRVQVVELDRPWARANFSTEHWNLLGYYNARDASKQTALSSGNNLVLDTNNWQFEVQTNWNLGSKARIVAGATYGEEEIDTFDPATGRQSLVFEPIDSDSSAVFAQLDWNLTDSLKLVLAGRFDDSSLHESKFSPKGSLVYSINPDNTLRFTYNEAFQVANYSEYFLQAQVGAFPGGVLQALVCSPFGVDCGLPAAIPVLALGNEDLELEEVKAYEVGYSGILNGKTFLTVDYYNTQNKNFITDLIPQTGTALGITNPNFQLISGLPPALAAALNSVVGSAVPGALLTRNLDGSPVIAAVSYTNFGDVDTQGVDVGLNHYFDNRWSISLSYSWFDFNIKEDLPGFEQLLVPNTPENKLSAGLSYVADRWDIGASARWVDTFRWAVGPFQGDVESYTTVDLNANFTINDHLALGLNVANLLDDEHWESFGGDLLGRRALGNVTFSW